MELQITWAHLTGASGILIGFGAIIERMRNGKYVKKDMCKQRHELEAERLKRVDENVDRLMNHFNLTPKNPKQ